MEKKVQLVTFDCLRIKALENARARGLTSGSVSPDSAPWVREGLSTLEKGETLTPDRLQEADRSQNMRLLHESFSTSNYITGFRERRF